MNERHDTSLETLTRLREGNLEWRSRGRTPGLELAPLDGPREAAVVCCSDLPLSPEIAFNQRFGDMLVVQVPGPFVDSAVTTTLRYGVATLGVKLVMVLTHDDCCVLHERSESPQRTSGFRAYVDHELYEARHAGVHAAETNAHAQARRIDELLASVVPVVPAVMHRGGEVEFLGKRA